MVPVPGDSFEYSFSVCPLCPTPTSRSTLCSHAAPDVLPHVPSCHVIILDTYLQCPRYPVFGQAWSNLSESPSQPTFFAKVFGETTLATVLYHG